jgi:ubiquitin C-terminal hydrolase
MHAAWSFKLTLFLYSVFSLHNPWYLCYQNSAVQALTTQNEFFEEADFETNSHLLNHLKEIYRIRAKGSRAGLDRAMVGFRKLVGKRVSADFKDPNIQADSGEFLSQLLFKVSNEIDRNDTTRDGENIIQSFFAMHFVEQKVCRR